MVSSATCASSQPASRAALATGPPSEARPRKCRPLAAAGTPEPVSAGATTMLATGPWAKFSARQSVTSSASVPEAASTASAPARRIAQQPTAQGVEEGGDGVTAGLGRSRQRFAAAAQPRGETAQAVDEENHSSSGAGAAGTP